MKSSASDVYEVRCPACNVSFPPETRRCIHCGARIPKGGGSPSNPAFVVESDGGVVTEAIGKDAPTDASLWPDFSNTDETPDDEAPSRRGWFRLGGSLIWVLLAILASLGQMCEGG